MIEDVVHRGARGRAPWASGLIDAVDWERTPVGPEAVWPQSLRTALGICFESRFPIIIFWGRELVQFYNEAYSAILGAKHPKAFGQRAQDCFPEIWDQIRPMLHGVLDTGNSTWSEDLMLALERNGFSEECYFTFSYSPINDEQGAEGVFCAVTETTAKVLREREARERVEALAELDRAKTEFFNNISHEFRTPLTLILGPLDDALSAGRNLDRGELDVLRRNARRLLRLVNTLLDYSRIDANRAALAPEAVDLPALTAEIASTFRSAFASGGIAFTIDTPPLDEPVAIDPRLWEHVVLNLLSNALKFTLEGEVRVSLHRRESLLRLEVADDGCGLTPSEAERAFERFWRGSGQPARTQEGSGIGLALVRQIAELHGGTARLESAPGEGTTAIVEIPYRAATAGGARASASSAADLILAETGTWGTSAASEAAASDATDRPVVMIVEDNADLREYIARLLAPAYRVIRAADGFAALAAVATETPDLILSDVMMPGLSGIELVRRLRAESATRDVPIVLLSARAEEGSTGEGIAAGADDYLVKPFSSAELLSRLERHLARSRIRAEEVARFRQLADEIPHMIWTHRADGALDWINKRWFEYTGLSYDRARSERRFDLVLEPADLARLRDLHRQYFARGEAFETEIRVKPHDAGEQAYRWHLARLVPVRDADGTIVRWIGSATDVHQRRELAEERERDLRALAEAVPQMVWRAQPDGTNDYFNARWFEYTGQTPAEAREGAFRAVHDDEREGTVRAWQESVARREPYEAEFRLKGADGAYRWFVARARPQLDERGEIVRWFGTTTDIDGQKRALEALAQSERRYRSLIETTTEGVWVVDRDDRTTFVNARTAELLGYAPEAMLGKPVWDFMDSASRLESQRLKVDIFAGTRSGGDVRFTRADGEEIWAHVSTSVILGDDGSVAGALGMLHDITERKRTEATAAILAEISGALAQSLGLRQTLDELLGVVVPKLATWAMVELRGEDPRHDDEPARVAAVLHAEPARNALAQQAVGSTDRRALIDLLGHASLGTARLASQGTQIGTITFASQERAFDDAEVALFAEIATRAEVAIEHARLYDRERRVAVSLQAAALPKKLPTVPGLVFSAATRLREAKRSWAATGTTPSASTTAGSSSRSATSWAAVSMRP